MRECIRCHTPMEKINGRGTTYTMLVSNLSKMVSSKYGNPHIAVCPKCGEVSIYFDIKSEGKVVV